MKSFVYSLTLIVLLGGVSGATAGKGLQMLEGTVGEAIPHPAGGQEPIPEFIAIEFDVKDYDPLIGTCHRGSLLRNGVFDTKGVALLKNSEKPKWVFDTGGPVKSSPVVVEGILYVGSDKGKFFALDPVDGKELWNIAVEGGVRSSACVKDGVVYFAGMNGYLYAADTKSGAVKWKVKASNKPIEGGVGVVYDTVFVNAITSAGFRVSDGKKVWEGRMGGMYKTQSITLTEQYLLFNRSSNYRVVALKLRDEKVQFYNGSDGMYSRSTAAVRNGVVCFANAGGVGAGPGYPGLNALTVEDFKPVFKGHPIEEHMEPELRKYCFSSPAMDETKIYIGMDSGFFYAFDQKTGKKVWSFKASHMIRVPVNLSAGDSTVYLGDNNGFVYALNTKNGALRWKFKTDGEVHAAVWPTPDAVYVGSDDGKVYCIE